MVTRPVSSPGILMMFAWIINLLVWAEIVNCLERVLTFCLDELWDSLPTAHHLSCLLSLFLFLPSLLGVWMRLKFFKFLQKMSTSSAFMSIVDSTPTYASHPPCHQVLVPPSHRLHKGAAVFELASAFWLSLFLYLPNLDESSCKWAQIGPSFRYLSVKTHICAGTTDEK